MTAARGAAFIQNTHADNGGHDAAPICDRVAEEGAPMRVRVRWYVEKYPGYQHYAGHQAQHVALEEVSLVMLTSLRRNIVIL